VGLNRVGRSMLTALAAWIALAALVAPPAGAAEQTIAERYPQAKSFFPKATRFGALEGEPRAAPVYRDEALVGYVFLTGDLVRIPAYSGKPINTLVGFDLAGSITGIAIVEHQEPILAVGVSEARLRAFADQYRGKRVFDRVTVGAERPGYVAVDTISGATITVMVLNQTIMSAARRVADSRGITPTGRRPIAQAPAAAQPAAPAPPATRIQTTPDEPLWIAVWQARVFQIGVLVVGLATLTAILLFQDALARHPNFLVVVRRGFLVYTVFFIGWFALAQLSIVQVLTFVHAAITDFRWETFLIDPMLFLLWSFVAMTLLLWGRGVYCGWLCPFGALQELINQGAQKLKLKQHEFSDVVHERLLGVKVLVLVALFGISLQSMGEAVRYAEIEPFKTAITLRFDRAWPFVLYAGGLLLVSAFNRKFFCKYLCPLGAALMFPGRFRIFDWLRRRKECGRPCQTCANQCEVRAIRPTGEINANECHYCLDCQVTYYNDRKCMPLIERREKRERRRARVPIVPAGDAGAPADGGS
jgi:NosR/NirI family nitrous oxide reductase transcriptional regulator